MSTLTVQQVCPPAPKIPLHRNWRLAIVLPREHGAWGMLAIPLLSGAAIGYVAGGRAWSALALVTIVAVAGFLLRTPAEALLGISLVRSVNAAERRVALGAMCVWVALAVTALILFTAHASIKPLLIPAGVAMTAILVQFAKGNRRDRLLSELLGAVALSGGAFLSYFAISSRTDQTAAVVWLMNALFAFDQILYVRSLLERVRNAGTCEIARRFYSAASLVGVLFLLIGAAYSFLPLGAIVAYMPLLARARWKEQSLRRVNLRNVGFRELVLSMVSCALLVGTFVTQPKPLS